MSVHPLLVHVSMKANCQAQTGTHCFDPALVTKTWSCQAHVIHDFAFAQILPLNRHLPRKQHSAHSVLALILVLWISLKYYSIA